MRDWIAFFLSMVALTERTYRLLKKLVAHYQDSQILEKLGSIPRNIPIPGPLRHEHESESDSGRADGGEGASGSHDSEPSQGRRWLPNMVAHSKILGRLRGTSQAEAGRESNSGGAAGEHGGEGGEGGSGPHDGERSQGQSDVAQHGADVDVGPHDGERSQGQSDVAQHGADVETTIDGASQ